MPTWAIYLIVALGACGAGAIQTACGFGAGVVLLLVLSRFLDMLSAPAVNLLICVFLTLSLSWRYRKQIQFGTILIPLIPYLVSSTLINLVVDRMDLGLLGVLFGVFQLALCAYYLLVARRLGTRTSTVAGILCGFFSGITASLFGVGGPLLAVFLLGACPTKESYTGSMQFVLFLTNLIIFSGKLLSGFFALSMLPMALAGILGVLAGQWCGERLTRRWDAERMKTVVYIFIGVSGLVTVLQYAL